MTFSFNNYSTMCGGPRTNDGRWLFITYYYFVFKSLRTITEGGHKRIPMWQIETIVRLLQSLPDLSSSVRKGIIVKIVMLSPLTFKVMQESL